MRLTNEYDDGITSITRQMYYRSRNLLLFKKTKINAT